MGFCLNKDTLYFEMIVDEACQVILQTFSDYTFQVSFTKKMKSLPHILLSNADNR